MDYINEKNLTLKGKNEMNDIQPSEDVLDLCSSFLPCEIVLKNHWLEGSKSDDVPLCDPIIIESNSSLDLSGSDLRNLTNDIPLENILYKCTLCSYESSTVQEFKSHQRNSHGAYSDTPTECFRCSICDFQTTLKRNLVRHEMNHSLQKRYTCDECDYQNNSRVLFNRHKRNHVVNFRNSKFKCPVCEFGSNDKNCWKEHVVTHDNVRLHECELCDYATTKLSDIKRHRGMHAKNDPNYRQCHQIHRMNDKRNTTIPFSTRENESTTDSTDVKFMCELCYYSTNFKGDLTSHMAIHKERKQLTCEECGYKTNYRFRLKNHKNTHKPEKPYKCTQCDFQTKHKVSLPRHVLNCHKDISVITYK